MKKRFVSTLMLGAMMVASASLTSCKDYDDDINANTDRIDGLEETIAALQEQHDADVKTLQDAQAEYATKIALQDTASAIRAAATAAAAQAEANATQTAQDLAESLQNAINNKADQSAVDELETTLKALIATKANQSDYEALLEKVNTLDGDTYSKSETDALIAEAKAALESEIGAINTALDTKLDKTTFEQKIDELTAAYKSGDTALDEKYAGIVATLATQSDLQQQIDALDALKELVNEQNLTNSGKFTDLDDKITDLNTRLTTLSENALTADDLSELNAFMETANNYLNNVLPDLLAAKANAADVYTKDEIDAKLSSVPVADNVYTKAETYSKAEVDNKLGTLSTDVLAQAKKDYEEALNAYKEEVTKALGSKVDTAQFSALESTVKGITSQVNSLNMLLTKSLTSLVFQAEKYALSFPEVEIASFDNLPVYTVDLTKDEPVTKSEDTYSYAPEAIAKYWMNPSSADYTQYTYKFVDLETTNETRAHRDTMKCVDNSSLSASAEDGVLTIKFKVDAANVNDAITHEENGRNVAWISTIALQATKKAADENDIDKTITSDYALLTPSWYNNLRLGNNAYKEEGTHNQGNQKYHINTTVAATMTEDAAYTYSFVLPYTGDSIVDLDNYIDLHYAFSANSTDITGDHVWTNAEAKEHGFTFKYTLLPTEEDKDGNKIVPADFKLDGTKVSVANTTRDAVGKNAIVLVEMQANGKTVAYGYVSFLISNNPVSMVEELSDLTLNCPATTDGTFDAKACYSELTDSLAKLLHYTPAEFNERYYLAGQATSRSKYLKSDGAEADTTLGKIVVENDTLYWKFTNDEIKKAFYNEDGTPNDVNEYTTWIQFTSKNTTLNPDFRIQVKIKAIHRPAGSFAYDDRIQQYWYAAGTGTVATSAETRAEIHANVEVVGQPNANDELKYDISSTFVGNDFNITRAEATPAFTFDTDAKVYFDATKYPCKALGASGATYDLKLNDAATELYAYDAEGKDQLVAKLTGDKNEIVEFQHNEYAEDLLNVASHTVLSVVPEEGSASTFTTHMVLDQKESCLPIILTGATKFDVRYLRPIDGVGSDAAQAYDAIDNGNKIYLADMVSFRDWRWTTTTTQYAFGGKGAKDADMTYINYYGITEIIPDLDNVTTNINGRDQLLSAVTNKITLSTTDEEGNSSIGTYTKGSSTTFADFRDAIGYIYYGNVGSTVGGFYLKIPVTVKYDWGTTAKTVITINVESTQGNAKRY